MTDHDPMCYAYGQPFRPVLFGGAKAPCDCERVARIRADERREVVLDHESGIVYRNIIVAEIAEQIAQAIEAVNVIVHSDTPPDVAMAKQQQNDAAIARRFKENSDD